MSTKSTGRHPHRPTFPVLLRSAVFLLGLGVSVAVSPPPARAETRKVTGTLGSVTVVARTEVFLASTLMSGNLESRSRTLVSPDADWSRATVFSTSFSDQAMQIEHKASGHMVIAHPGGDQAFVQYEVTWKNVGSIEVEWQYVGRFVRGTGRFKGIAGTWRERGRSAATGDSGDWEVEYTLP